MSASAKGAAAAQKAASLDRNRGHPCVGQKGDPATRTVLKPRSAQAARAAAAMPGSGTDVVFQLAQSPCTRFTEASGREGVENARAAKHSKSKRGMERVVFLGVWFWKEEEEKEREERERRKKDKKRREKGRRKEEKEGSSFFFWS